MEKVLHITKRLKEKKRKRDDEALRMRAEGVRRTVQCASCPLSCAMCGVPLETDCTSCPGFWATYSPNLCDHCQAEYRDFLKLYKGGKEADIPWHSEAWMRLWASWVEHQKAIKAFRNSKAFKKLMEDFE